jgi:hypothetical protein
MKLPWQDNTGTAKLTAILATTFCIALGLCGANFVAVIMFVPLAGPAPPAGTSEWPSQILTITGIIEILAMGISAPGLVVIGIITIARAIKNHFTY